MLTECQEISQFPSYSFDIPWILHLFNHGICDLLSILYGFGICFRVFSGSGTFWRALVILESFEVQNCIYASEVYL